MPRSPAQSRIRPARIRPEILALVAAIPAGRLTSCNAIGRQLDVSPRHVVTVLATLGERERQNLPWWRVVADGGAIGRHKWRETQIRYLQAEGIAVAPAGIVCDLAARFLESVPVTAGAKPQDTAQAVPAGQPKLSRARGSKRHTTTS